MTCAAPMVRPPARCPAEYVFDPMSRGVDRTNAERMIVQGFFEEVLNRIPVAGVRNKLETEIARKLGL